MSGNGGLWIALPQKESEQDGERKYFDLMYLTPPEAEHVRKLVLADLEAQGHIDRPVAPKSARQRPARANHKTPEGEDVSQYYSSQADNDDDIPF
jgi:hypothetical protein